MKFKGAIWDAKLVIIICTIVIVYGIEYYILECANYFNLG